MSYIKSVYGSGRYKYFWVDLPIPTPVNPPLFIAMYPLHTWFPVVNNFEHGLEKPVRRDACLSFNNFVTDPDANIIPIKATIPSIRKENLILYFFAIGTDIKIAPTIHA